MRMSNANDTKQTKALAPAEQKQLTIKKLFDQSKGALAQVLPKHVTPERMLKVALTATSRNPDLLACKPMSLLRAVFQAGELGLEAGGLLGEGYLVPFKDEVQFIPGYRGLIKLARQSGQLASIEARVVYELDAFELEYGLEPKLLHKPYLGGENRGPLKFVYAIALLKDGGKLSCLFEQLVRGQPIRDRQTLFRVYGGLIPGGVCCMERPVSTVRPLNRVGSRGSPRHR